MVVHFCSVLEQAYVFDLKYIGFLPPLKLTLGDLRHSGFFLTSFTMLTIVSAVVGGAIRASWCVDQNVIRTCVSFDIGAKFWNIDREKAAETVLTRSDLEILCISLHALLLIVILNWDTSKMLWLITHFGWLSPEKTDTRARMNIAIHIVWCD